MHRRSQVSVCRRLCVRQCDILIYEQQLLISRMAFSLFPVCLAYLSHKFSLEDFLLQSVRINVSRIHSRCQRSPVSARACTNTSIVSAFIDTSSALSSSYEEKKNEDEKRPKI